MEVLWFLMHVDFFEKTDQKILSIDDISRFNLIINWANIARYNRRYRGDLDEMGSHQLSYSVLYKRE